MTLRPLGKNIIFQFLDEITGSKGALVSRPTASGIIIPHTAASQQKLPRWGKVVAVGPDVDGIVAGEYILIEPLMWTFGAKLNDKEKVWKTDETKVLLVTDDREACEPQ